MKESKKNFNKYLFLTTFSRNLIEVFVGTILLKNGYSLTNVIFYYLLVNLFSFILGIPCTLLSKKYSNKILAIIGIVSFILLQVSLNFISGSIIYLYLVSFLFALYRRCYWISRRYYMFQVIDDDKNISKMFSFISILNQLGVMLSSYLGSILLQFLDINVITIISIVLLIISTYYIYKIDISYEKNDIKLRLFETLRCIPKSSLVMIGCYELQNVFKFLLPLYLVIYVKDTYQIIGIVNLIANLATLVFIYIYGRLINKDKNYLKLSIILVVLIRILEVNTVGILLLIVSFIEGFLSKMYEQSYSKDYLILSKNYEYYNYNFVYEMVQNTSRLLVVLFIYLFIHDLKLMIYFVLFLISLSLIFKFRLKPTNTDSEVIWKE